MYRPLGKLNRFILDLRKGTLELTGTEDEYYRASQDSEATPRFKQNEDESETEPVPSGFVVNPDILICALRYQMVSI